MPDAYKFGGGGTATVLHPLVLVAMILAVILIFVLPRKYLIGPLIFMAFLVPMGQQLYIAGVHLFVLRVVILVAFIRAMATKGHGEPLLANGWNGVDTASAIYMVAVAVATCLTFRLDTGVLINQVGYVWDFLLGYVVIRCLVRDEDGLYTALKFLAIVTIPLAVGMIIEQRSMVNVFGMLGGVQAVPDVREGKIRSQGAFEHALMAGTFSATLLPVLVMFWRKGQSKLFGMIGVVGAVVMTWTSNSSTPLLAFVAGVFGLLCWPIRKSMKKVRWGMVYTLVALQLVMKAPVWFLIARVDLTGGSSSYHRAELVDQFMNHIPEWFLIGVKDPSDWGLDMWDVQNQYVNVGEAGGIVALVCFIMLISRSFGMLGNARKAVDGQKDKEWMLWCLGSAMFANVVGFFGVNYFDQSRMWWFILLAMIPAICVPMLQSQGAGPVVVEEEKLKVRKAWLKVEGGKASEEDMALQRPGKLVPRLRFARRRHV
jgi:hypothetical protein